MPKKINCKIQIDTSMNDEQLVDALIVEHSISGGMSASQDWEDSYTLRFSLFTTPMKAWNKLHRIAQS